MYRYRPASAPPQNVQPASLLRVQSSKRAYASRNHISDLRPRRRDLASVAQQRRRIHDFASAARSMENPVTLERRRRMGLGAGLMVPPIVTTASFLAIEAQNRFNYGTHNISSLEEGRTEFLIRPGFASAGIMLMGFTYGLRKTLPNSRYYDVPAAVLAESGLAFTVAPLYDATATVHYYASGYFFSGFPIAMGMIGAGLIKDNFKAAGAATLATAGGTGAVVTLGLLSKHPVPATYEIMEGVLVGTWVFATSAYLLLKDKISGAFKRDRNDRKASRALRAIQNTSEGTGLRDMLRNNCATIASVGAISGVAATVACTITIHYQNVFLTGAETAASSVGALIAYYAAKSAARTLTQTLRSAKRTS